MIVKEYLKELSAIDQGRPRKRVTVLGAGMAGLVAAYELSCLGHDVELYEASSRVGGRVQTHKFSDGTYGELGAMRLPAIHVYTRHYISLMGLQLRPFVSSHGNLECFYDIRGVQTRMKNCQADLYPQFNLSTHEAQAPVGPAILDEHFNNLVHTLTHDEVQELTEGPLKSDRLRSLDRISLGEFFERRAGYDATTLIGASTGLEPWWNRAITIFLREQVLEPWKGLEEIVGGMESLPKALASRLKCSIHYRHRVIAISPHSDHVDVEFEHDGGTRQCRCDYVICAIPFSVLRTVDISPAFSPKKMMAIRNISYASSTKVLLHCRERFWESKYGIYGGASQSDQLIRATYYPSDVKSKFHADSKNSWWGGLQKSCALSASEDAPKPRAGVLLGSYCWDQDARRLGALRGRRASDPAGTISERAAAVIRMIKRFHPEIDSFVDDEASMFWDENPYAAGVFAFLAPGDRSTLLDYAAAAEGRCHFAGEHCSLDHAWVEGAVTSALNAVTEIAKI